MEEEVISGARTVSGHRDELSQTLDNPEHPGRVRGMGVRVGFKDVFRQSKKRGQREKQVGMLERLRLQMKVDYDRQLVEMESRMIQRLDSRLERPAENQAPILLGIRRSIQASGTWEDEFDKLEVIPVPTEMMRLLDDTRPSSIQWPKSQIILDEESHLYSPVHTEREPVIATDSVHMERELDVVTDPIHTERQLVVATDSLGSTKGCLLITGQEYSLLPPGCRHLHDKLITRPDMVGLMIVIEIPPDMFLHDGSQGWLSLKEFKDFFHASGSDRWLESGHITVFAM